MKRIIINSCATLAIACVVIAGEETKPGSSDSSRVPDRKVESGSGAVAPVGQDLTKREGTAEPSVGKTNSTPIAKAAPFAAGQILFIDPKTGWPSQFPPTIPIELTTNAAFSTSTQGLAETPSPIQNGGFGVDLQGRFQIMTIATVGGDGRLRTICSPSTTSSVATNSVGPSPATGKQ